MVSQRAKSLNSNIGTKLMSQIAEIINNNWKKAHERKSTWREPDSAKDWLLVTLYAARWDYEYDPNHGVNDDDIGGFPEIPAGFYDADSDLSGEAVPFPFGYESLIDNLLAKVLVVENEPEAKAAAAVFPDYAVIAPVAGVDLGDTNLALIKGRDVTIWGNASSSGVAFAKAAAETLFTAKAGSVRFIDGAALSRISPHSGDRPASSEWSISDAVADWADLSALRKAALEQIKHSAPPSLLSFDEFQMTPTGLFVTVMNGKKAVRLRVSDAFEILGESRDSDGKGWGKWVKIADRDGGAHTLNIRNSDLQGDPSVAASKMADAGLVVIKAAQKYLQSYLIQVRADARVRRVDSTGWHQINGKDVFTLPSGTLGDTSGETVVLAGAVHSPYSTSGTLEQWIEHVAKPAGEHFLPRIAISTALSGPLLYLAAVEGGGVHIYGDSGLGKTTLGDITASTWGKGGSKGFSKSWSATENALEAVAAITSDSCLVLDELGSGDARAVHKAIYSLANGAGRSRAQRDGELRQNKTYRTVTFSTGEMKIGQKLKEDSSRRVMAGQMVRTMDVPADRGKGHGAFDFAGPTGNAGDIANAFKAATTTYYGSAGPAFVAALLERNIDGESIRRSISTFEKENVPKDSAPQVHRGARRFGLFAAAGELGIEFGILPWPKGVATEAAVWAFKEWVSGRGGKVSYERLDAVAQIRLILERDGDGRFEDTTEGGRDKEGNELRKIHNRLGWRINTGEHRRWMIPAETWASVFCEGKNPQAVAEVLRDEGFLAHDAGRLQKRCRVQGSLMSLYVLKGTILGYHKDPLFPGTEIKLDGPLQTHEGETMDELDAKKAAMAAKKAEQEKERDETEAAYEEAVAVGLIGED
jgi:putative DNA primase/helicase